MLTRYQTNSIMNTAMEDLKGYENFLRKLAENDSSTIISNGGKDHAVILYSVLFDNTDKEVRIFCQSGNSEVWQDPVFIEALDKFLEKPGTDLKVLTAGEPSLASRWTDKGNVDAFHIQEADKELIYTHFRNRKCNFAVFDKKRYRYEFNCDEFKAYGSFNAPEDSNEMAEMFDAAFVNASR